MPTATTSVRHTRRATRPGGTDAKARTYLAEGRVRAESVDATGATFRVRGSGPVPYLVRYRHGHWHCTCPARVTCCHVKACALVAPTTG